MTDLRNLNRAVQSAEYPSHEWAQAVREWIDKATKKMEPSTEVKRPRCNPYDHHWAWGGCLDCANPQPASEGAKVECPNCRKMAGNAEHFHYSPAGYTCQPAQPEPAAPEDCRYPNCDCRIPCCEMSAGAALRKEPAPPRAMPDSGAPDGTPYEIAEAVAKLSWHGEKQEAHNLAGWWMRLRTHAAQPKVAMTEELESLVAIAMQAASEADWFASQNSNASPQRGANIRKAIESVLAQAAGVKP